MKNLSAFGIDLFAGAGGLSLGAQLAGVKVTHAIESDCWAADTYRNNHPSTTVIEKDVRFVKPLEREKKGVFILFGGPPCQGFSTSNQRTRTLQNPKNWLFGEFFRFAASMQPDWIVLENVKGLRETAQGLFENLIMAELAALRYEAALWVLSADRFGVPQKRIRLFFVARKLGKVPPSPSPIKESSVTVRDAIEDLPLLRSGANTNVLKYRAAAKSDYARAMRHKLQDCSGHLVSTNNKLVQSRYEFIPPGGNWRDVPKRLMRNYTNLVDARSRHTGIYRRLEWDEPSIVIANYRKNMLIHPEQHRGLSVREAARLQSFPDRYQFSGSIGFQQQQVSNAVPPLLSKAVFSHILAHS